jgi:hypothetical protein
METVGNTLDTEKVAHKYTCIVCDYVCSKISNWKKHKMTAKHQMETNGNVLETKSSQSSHNPYKCKVCEKVYQNRSGLWKHSKICNQPSTIQQPLVITEDLLLKLVKQSADILVKQSTDMMEQVLKAGNANNNSNTINNNTNNTNNTNKNNCHNKSFNLNFFLNETCKNAMNITEFVDSIKIQLQDLERFGEVGYVEGLSNIITTNLKELDVTERPVHCMDKKRETIYIKDQDKWEKEDDNRTKLRKVIKRIASKNYKLLPSYREKYPGCQSASSRFSDKYNKMMVEVMGGAGNNDLEKEDKIIHNISKKIVVDK